MVPVEQRFLLECLAEGVAPLRGNGARELLPAPKDWDYVLRLAQANDVAPVLHRVLLEIGDAENVPERAGKQLALAYHRVGFRNGRNYSRLAEVVSALRGAGVDVIVLKGAALASTVWGNIALRPMADVDIMVPEERIRLAEETMLDLGYGIDESAHPREWYLERSHQLAPFLKEDPRTEFDIHRNIVDPNSRIRAAIDVRDLWTRSVPADLQGIPARVLSPEDTVIHLCLHHCMYLPFWGKIKNLMDLAKLLEGGGGAVDWDSVLRVSRDSRISRYLYHPLKVAEATFRIGLDGEVLRRLKKMSGLSLMEESFLGAIHRRNLLITDERSSVFPHWVLTRFSEDMLFCTSTPAKWTSVLRTLAMPPSPGDFSAGAPPAKAREVVSLLVRRAGKFLRKTGTAKSARRDVPEKSGTSPAG